MNIVFYNLMYIDLSEKRLLAGKVYSDEQRIDVFVKNSCVLDKSLKINNILGGVIILTNNREAILQSIHRIGYPDIKVQEINFSLDVPKGIRFYSAHFKIDAFRYFSTRPKTEYQIMLDSDVVCLHSFSDEFMSIIGEGLPTVYYLNVEGGDKKLKDVKTIVDDVSWLPWAGGEYIGGTADFFKSLYDEIVTFKDKYWKALNNELYHIGDEMLTSIALARLRKKNFYPINVAPFCIIYRYWSVFETQRLFDVNTSFIHLPGDKIFLKRVNLNSNNVQDLLKGYESYHQLQRLKQFVKKVIRKK